MGAHDSICDATCARCGRTSGGGQFYFFAPEFGTHANRAFEVGVTLPIERALLDEWAQGVRTSEDYAPLVPWKRGEPLVFLGEAEDLMESCCRAPALPRYTVELSERAGTGEASARLISATTVPVAELFGGSPRAHFAPAYPFFGDTPDVQQASVRAPDRLAIFSRRALAQWFAWRLWKRKAVPFDALDPDALRVVTHDLEFTAVVAHDGVTVYALLGDDVLIGSATEVLPSVPDAIFEESAFALRDIAK